MNKASFNLPTRISVRRIINVNNKFIINQLNPTTNKREELDTIKRFIIASTEEF